MEDKGEGKGGEQVEDISHASLHLVVQLEYEGTGAVHSGKSVLFIVISSHMLCTLDPYAHVRYAYVTHTLAYVMYTLLIRSHTLCIRYSYARIRYPYATITDRRRQLGFNTQKLCVKVVFTEFFIRYSYVLSYAVV